MREGERSLPPLLIFPESIHRPTLFAANAAYLLCAVGIVLSSVVFAFVASLIPSAYYKLSYYLVSSVLEVAIFALPPILYALKRPNVIHAFRLNTPTGSMVVLAIVLSVLCFFASNVLGTLWALVVESLGGSLANNSLLVPASANDLLMLIVVTGFLPGICEEVMFRGMLLGAWEAYGSKWAMVITSFLFAILHASVLGFPTQLLAAFSLSMLALCSDSIYPGIIFHVLYNSALLVASYLSASSGDAVDGLTIYEYIGGMAGTLKTCLSLAFLLALIFGVLASIYNIGAKRRRIFMSRERNVRLGAREVIVFAAAFVTVAAMFALNIVKVFKVSL